MINKEYILQITCNDKLGTVAIICNVLKNLNLFICELSQFTDPANNKLFMRVHYRVTKNISEEEVKESFTLSFKEHNMDWQLYDCDNKLNAIIMVSKYSHCLNDLLHRWSSKILPINIVAVISNHKDLETMVSWYKLPFYYLPINSNNKEQQENQLLDIYKQHNTDFLILARYMQIISNKMCQQLFGKIINIHHSCLPSFKGAKPYHQAYQHGVKTIGATAHYVTPNLDEGPIIDQETIKVRHDQSLEQLIKMGQNVECQALARAVSYHAEHRVFINGQKTVVFN